MSSHKCFFTEISSLEKYADPEIKRIQIGVINENRVIVGMNSKVGDTGIFFYPDCQLSKKFMQEHELKSSSFKNCRVRVSRFKGEWSEGLFIPMDASEVESIWGDKYELGESLPEHTNVYTVYEPVIKIPTISSNQAGGKFKRGSLPTFPMHFDTEQFRSHLKDFENKFRDGWDISISLKVHGSSGRTGYVRVPSEPNIFEKTKLFFMKAFHVSTKNYRNSLDEKYFFVPGNYEIVNGSRRVILTEEKIKEDSGFHSSSFRDRTSYFRDFIEKDVVVFYEILGWESLDKSIMAKGPSGHYDYGIPNGEFAIQVYRITIGGKDLSPPEMEGYARSFLNLEPVFRMTEIININSIYVSEDPFHYLMKIVSQKFEECRHIDELTYIDTKCERVTRVYSNLNEGIVIRLDPPVGVPSGVSPTFYKLKLPEFYEEEGMVKAAEMAKMSLEQE